MPLSTPRPLPMSLMRKLHRRTEKVRPSAAGHEPGGCSHRLWSATGAPRGLLSIENSSSQGVSPAAAPAESRPVDVNRVSGDRGDHHRGHSPRGDRPAPKDRSGDPCWADSPRGCCFVDNSPYPSRSARSSDCPECLAGVPRGATHRPLHAPRSSPSEPVRRSPPPQPEPPSPAPSPATPPRRSSCLPAPAPSSSACSASCPSPPTAGPAAQRLTRQPT